MHVKPRERAKTVVNIGRRVDILRKEKKKITVLTAKNMDTSLKNVTERRSMGKNASTVTIRVTKKRYAGIYKNMTE